MMNYLALGDSYTIGEGVIASHAFPYLLAEALGQQGVVTKEAQIIAKTGWTTDELIQAIAEVKPAANFDLVTLLIGVNNQYRGYPKEQYAKEFQNLLEQSLGFAQGNQQAVYVLSIPDWGKTPFGAQSNRDRTLIAQEIDAYNLLAQHICNQFGVSFTDITSLTRDLDKFEQPLAADNLHYALAMHRAWVNQLLPKLTFR